MCTDGTSATLTTSVPTRTGYAFSSWNTASDGTGISYASGGSIACADVTLYAQWDPGVQAFALLGGSGATAVTATDQTRATAVIGATALSALNSGVVVATTEADSELWRVDSGLTGLITMTEVTGTTGALVGDAGNPSVRHVDLSTGSLTTVATVSAVKSDLSSVALNATGSASLSDGTTFMVGSTDTVAGTGATFTATGPTSTVTATTSNTGHHSFIAIFDASGEPLYLETWPVALNAATNPPVIAAATISGTAIVALASPGVSTVDYRVWDPSGGTLTSQWLFLAPTDATTRDVEIAPDGTVYAVGTLAATIDFDPGVGTVTLTHGGAAGNDGFVAAFSNAGSVRWAKRFGSTTPTRLYTSRVSAVLADSSIAMSVPSGVVFTIGEKASPEMSVTTSGAAENGYLFTLDSAGTPQWIRYVADPGTTGFAGVSTSSTHLFVGTRRASTTIDVDGTLTHTGTGPNLVRYSTGGSALL